MTEDGKVYGWGMNAEGALGTGNTNDQCEGPALVESLGTRF
jgi:alpha-tubulin suppressor-like RCC1 family protein